MIDKGLQHIPYLCFVIQPFCSGCYYIQTAQEENRGDSEKIRNLCIYLAPVGGGLRPKFRISDLEAMF